MELEDVLELEKCDECFLLEDFHDAIIGVVHVAGNLVALYDKDMLITILICRDGLTEDEALEQYEYNFVNAFSGDKAPFFGTLLK